MAYTTIDDPTIYFNTVLYAGDDSTSNAITGVGFQPDLIWIKNRSAASSHLFQDSVRGKSGSNFLFLQGNDTAAESAQGDNDGVNTIGSDGFTVGYTNSVGWNASGDNYCAWNWLAGGTASSNTDGTITSTVSANTTSGFSIVSYTGTGANATVGHGLGTSDIGAIIFKNRDDGTRNWKVYHKALGATKQLNLNLTLAATTETSSFNDTEPTSSVFSIGTSTDTNKNTDNIIAYCFAEKKGYSKFGSYTGNGNADGPFVYTGFKPAFVIIDNINQADDWYMFDNKRSSFNQVQANLKPNADSAEASSTSYALDFLSNGFKLRASTGAVNNNTDTLMYMAFAESPFVNSNKVPNNAR